MIVTGTEGQVVRALRERAGPIGIDLVAIGRPKLDLLDPDAAERTLSAMRADLVVNTAAYTAVDRAETDAATAEAVNGAGAGAVARGAARIGAPVLHLSTDYVFDGTSDRPYREDDPVNPLGVYGRSKLAGEEAVAAATNRHVILRTAWVYSPFGANFVKTMLRLGETRDVVRVVADQWGSPTAAHDIADAVFAIGRRLTASSGHPELFGIFHTVGQGTATWADFAEAIFAEAERHGRPPVRVERITTADYPTPARRPASSRLDPGKLSRAYGLSLPPWRESLTRCVEHLIAVRTF